MVSQVTLGGEDLSTIGDVAPERLLSCMDPNMSLEVSIFCKAFSTYLTFEGFFSSVGPFVDFEPA